MAKPKKPDRESSWLSIAQLSNALDLDQSYCRREVLRYAKPEHIRTSGRRKFYKARPILEAYLMNQVRPVADDFDEISFLIALNEADPKEWQ